MDAYNDEVDEEMEDVWEQDGPPDTVSAVSHHY